MGFDVDEYRILGVCLCVSRSVISNSATPWTVACQPPLSMKFSRQENCSGLPFPSPGDIPKAWIEPGSPTLHSLLPEPLGNTHISSYKALISYFFCTVFQYLESEVLFCASRTIKQCWIIVNNLYYKQRLEKIVKLMNLILLIIA